MTPLSTVAEPEIGRRSNATGVRVAIEVAPKRRDAVPVARSSEPVTIGLSFPRKACPDAEALTLYDANDRPRPLQARTLDRWPDGSVRWALVDFQATVAASAASRYTVAVDRPGDRVAPEHRVTLSSGSNGIEVDTGAARFAISARGRFPFERVTVGDRDVVDAVRTALTFEEASGEPLTLHIDSVRIDEDGPLRSVVLCEGTVRARRAVPRLEVSVRLHFFAGSATVRVALTVRNPAAADHPGGHWRLGAGGSVFLRDVSLRLALAGSDATATVRCSPECEQAHESYDAPFELYQESSGGDQWNSRNHVNRDGVVPHSLRGYRLRAGDVERRGERASPVVSLSRAGAMLGIAPSQFWQNFPKAIEADRDTVTLRLFPRQYPDIHEIQGGEQKTHVFHLAFDRDRVTTTPLDWCRRPLLARADPAWTCATGAVPYLEPVSDGEVTARAALTQSAIEGAEAFERKREVIDEYGWRHFGDVYADHEAVAQVDGAPLVSHYNNQYDGIAGFAYQFLQSADPRWWTLMEDLAAHVVDIDTYHTDADKAAYNHGLFWHTFHYVDAAEAGHRSYPKHPKVGGGGPSAEHNYSTGLLLHYFLTGEPLSRDAVRAFAQWVVDMDNGDKTVFRWVDRGDTGLASASGSPLYHGPGRGAGNSIVALLNGHRVSGEARFLDKAEQLIRRCIHPADDLEARTLLDAERRWYYTVFLQAIGKYLDYKAELGAIDEAYVYARASLLHYATWMLDHEYPYLDQPEILEYPTETWAAQDMRKSDVFEFAATHADWCLRERFRERSRFFFEGSIATLSAMPTRTLARPVTLMLTNGLMRAAGVSARDAQTPPPTSASIDFGRPEVFVPQKVRAMARLRLIAAAGAVALAAIAVTLLLLLLLLR